MTFKPADGGEPMEMTVKEFAGREGGKGGCGMGMFNTTEVRNETYHSYQLLVICRLLFCLNMIE